MTPIFDRDSELVGWLDGDNLFDVNLDWVAFNSGGNFFSSSNLEWLSFQVDSRHMETAGVVGTGLPPPSRLATTNRPAAVG